MIFQWISLILKILRRKCNYINIKFRLLFEKGEDFSSRLANFNFKSVPNNNSDVL